MKSSQHCHFLQQWVMASDLCRHSHLLRWSSPDPRNCLSSWEWCPDAGTVCVPHSVLGGCLHVEGCPIQEFEDDSPREAGYPLDLSSVDAPRNSGHLCRLTSHTYCGSVHHPALTLDPRLAPDRSDLSGHRRLSSAVHLRPDTHCELPSDSQRTGYHGHSENSRILAEVQTGFALLST